MGIFDERRGGSSRKIARKSPKTTALILRRNQKSYTQTA
ncbi:hypothetical protein CAMRE0001_2081 [Campylobacter rectus RM3267]|uniref:Uncharacterized protein n=1 Tax=Campylobacter rectus RM3267 TaxID=553218 RepID=B9D4M3_CAMRE|nr:hypothetical protein CAMRE0001_2081 [Campylobacter rectus RM3267]